MLAKDEFFCYLRARRKEVDDGEPADGDRDPDAAEMAVIEW